MSSVPIRRSHRLIPHTADAGLEARAPALPALFEEAAAALGELTADVEAGPPAGRAPDDEDVELEAPDLPALAFTWLGELIALIDVRRSAIVGATVRSIEGSDPGWRLEGGVRLVPFDGRAVRRRDDVKSPTYHGLRVEPVEGGWRLVAYVDI